MSLSFVISNQPISKREKIRTFDLHKISSPNEQCFVNIFLVINDKDSTQTVPKSTEY